LLVRDWCHIVDSSMNALAVVEELAVVENSRSGGRPDPAASNYCARGCSQRAELFGAELTAIDGQPMEEVFAQVAPWVAADNEMQRYNGSSMLMVTGDSPVILSTFTTLQLQIMLT
jgi:hypothetical protein